MPSLGNLLAYRHPAQTSTTRGYGGSIAFPFPLMLLDQSLSEIGVLCPNENPDVEDVGEPGLTLVRPTHRECPHCAGRS